MLLVGLRAVAHHLGKEVVAGTPYEYLAKSSDAFRWFVEHDVTANGHVATVHNRLHFYAHGKDVRTAVARHWTHHSPDAALKIYDDLLTGSQERINRVLTGRLGPNGPPFRIEIVDRSTQSAWKLLEFAKGVTVAPLEVLEAILVSRLDTPDDFDKHIEAPHTVREAMLYLEVLEAILVSRLDAPDDFDNHVETLHTMFGAVSGRSTSTATTVVENADVDEVDRKVQDAPDVNVVEAVVSPDAQTEVPTQVDSDVPAEFKCDVQVEPKLVRMSGVASSPVSDNGGMRSVTGRYDELQEIVIRRRLERYLTSGVHERPYKLGKHDMDFTIDKEVPVARFTTSGGGPHFEDSREDFRPSSAYGWMVASDLVDVRARLSMTKSGPTPDSKDGLQTRMCAETFDAATREQRLTFLRERSMYMAMVCYLLPGQITGADAGAKAYARALSHVITTLTTDLFHDFVVGAYREARESPLDLNRIRDDILADLGSRRRRLTNLGDHIRGRMLFAHVFEGPVELALAERLARHTSLIRDPSYERGNCYWTSVPADEIDPAGDSKERTPTTTPGTLIDICFSAGTAYVPAGPYSRCVRRWFANINARRGLRKRNHELLKLMSTDKYLGSSKVLEAERSRSPDFLCEVDDIVATPGYSVSFLKRFILAVTWPRRFTDSNGPDLDYSADGVNHFILDFWK